MHARIVDPDGNTCLGATRYRPDDGSFALKYEGQIQGVEFQLTTDLATNKWSMINFKKTSTGTHVLSHSGVLIQFDRQHDRHTLIFASLCRGYGGMCHDESMLAHLLPKCMI